jgi:hypothetical protein
MYFVRDTCTLTYSVSIVANLSNITYFIICTNSARSCSTLTNGLVYLKLIHEVKGYESHAKLQPRSLTPTTTVLY